MTDERRGKRSPKTCQEVRIGGEDYDIGFGEDMPRPSVAGGKEIHPVPEEERPRVEDHEVHHDEVRPSKGQYKIVSRP